ncbi:GNAT family N-acetyltransferase [Neobacillus massiliamazoniensis]|uniref:Acetyltransferase, GNAT family n=1 Tax=Neobacillus massiliamazoniensis TaxID=1499688 RepID=A0A0U1NZ85_9BACI|nr:GNAT family N-acetyltransferase [Neobacillus massiliamazoniensis]CRK83334.1 acetyltransferase, GNAT family [Neobacillus massiliamazoniensis]
MIEVKKAEIEHINGIIKVCSEGYRDTYMETHSNEYIERIINEFYNYERIHNEVTHTNSGWDGWYVATEENIVVGAIGGGLISKDQSEIFVLYLDPNRRGEGIGTKILQAITEIQRSNGAIKQWVSVAKGNAKGIPFYEARQFQFVQEQTSFANMDNESYVTLRYCRTI